MPSLCVLVNDCEVAVADTTGMFLVDATILTDCRKEQFAVLRSDGSERVDTGRMPFHIWLDEHDLREGDVVTIALREHGLNHPVPKTLDELYPDGPKDWVKPSEQEFRELGKAYAARPLQRQGYVLRAEPSFGAPVEVRTALEGDSLAVHCVWQMDCPGEARFWITNSAVDGDTGAYAHSQLMRTKLPLGESISMTLSASTGRYAEEQDFIGHE